MIGTRVDLRVRGGDGTNTTQIATTAGRSPRARRRREALGALVNAGGSISACAEETTARTAQSWDGQVDLRVRGGDQIVGGAV